MNSLMHLRIGSVYCLLKPVVSEADRGWAVGMQDAGIHIHESTIPDLIVFGGI